MTRTSHSQEMCFNTKWPTPPQNWLKYQIYLNISWSLFTTFYFQKNTFTKTCLTFNSSLTAGPRKMMVLRSSKTSGTIHPKTKHHIPKALNLLHVTLGWNYRVNSLFYRWWIGKKFSHYIQVKHGTSVIKTQDFLPLLQIQDIQIWKYTN